ncbi:unnamed protein product, partial [Dovyalis caffra]
MGVRASHGSLTENVDKFSVGRGAAAGPCTRVVSLKSGYGLRVKVKPRRFRMPY